MVKDAAWCIGVDRQSERFGDGVQGRSRGNDFTGIRLCCSKVDAVVRGCASVDARD